MLKGCSFEGRYIDLGFNEYESSNQFSIVVGKNGTGKSRLLNNLVQNFLPLHVSNRPMRDSVRHFGTDDFNVNFSRLPSRIIAVSTSPFDKFPLAVRDTAVDEYRYLGLRGLQSVNLGLAFMSRTIGNLVDAILRDAKRAKVVGSTLRDLGYYPYLKARLLPTFSSSELKELLSAPDPASFLLHEGRFARRGRVNTPYGMSLGGASRRSYEDDEDARDKAAAVLAAIRQLADRDMFGRQEILFTDEGMTELRHNSPIGPEHVLLMETGLFRLRDVELQKGGSLKPFKINDASSGEQCVVMTLIGIASHIEDNALICIDEPEVCLHPEWQERYMEKLISTFQDFRECHFVIATHSPQIVANLRELNCFVTDIETGTATAAAELSHRSADFQLVNVFNTPGYKNEYLSRELIATLATISSELNPSNSTLEKARRLISVKPALHKTDPLNALVDMLTSALQEVGL